MTKLEPHICGLTITEFLIIWQWVESETDVCGFYHCCPKPGVVPPSNPVREREKALLGFIRAPPSDWAQRKLTPKPTNRGP